MKESVVSTSKYKQASRMTTNVEDAMNKGKERKKKKLFELDFCENPKTTRSMIQWYSKFFFPLSTENMLLTHRLTVMPNGRERGKNNNMHRFGAEH